MFQFFRFYSHSLSSRLCSLIHSPICRSRAGPRLPCQNNLTLLLLPLTSLLSKRTIRTLSIRAFVSPLSLSSSQKLLYTFFLPCPCSLNLYHSCRSRAGPRLPCQNNITFHIPLLSHSLLSCIRHFFPFPLALPLANVCYNILCAANILFFGLAER